MTNQCDRLLYFDDDEDLHNTEFQFDSTDNETMLSARLNPQLKPSLMLFLDEMPSNSSLAFQVAMTYTSELMNKFSSTHLLLSEPDRRNRLNSLKTKMKVIDLFANDTSIDRSMIENNEKSLIIIDSLPWLLLQTSEGNLFRLLHQWSQSHLVLAIVPLDCLDDEMILKHFISIASWSIRVRLSPNSETIETRIEQRGKISVDTIKSILRFSIDSQCNVTNLTEEKISNRKSKSKAGGENSSKTDFTANLTFNLRLKDDELTAKNNLVLPYTKQQSQNNDDQFTIHYSYEKEDDIDEDEDDDLTLLMSENESNKSSDPIRSELIDTAVNFLKNARVAKEPMERKRAFLQKKGLTDTEINYAFQLISATEPSKEIVVASSRSSFLRRILTDLIIAGLLGYAWKLLQRWFRSKDAENRTGLNDTIRSLQLTLEGIQSSVRKLEQAADQLHLASLNRSSSASMLEEIKGEIQSLKGLCLNRSQFPSIPSIPARIPSWQLEAAEKSKSRSSLPLGSNDENHSRSTQEDNESIVVIPDHDKKSDDEHRLSTSPSSDSAGEN